MCTRKRLVCYSSRIRNVSMLKQQNNCSPRMGKRFGTEEEQDAYRDRRKTPSNRRSNVNCADWEKDVGWLILQRINPSLGYFYQSQFNNYGFQGDTVQKYIFTITLNKLTLHILLQCQCFENWCFNKVLNNLINWQNPSKHYYSGSE